MIACRRRRRFSILAPRIPTFRRLRDDRVNRVGLVRHQRHLGRSRKRVVGNRVCMVGWRGVWSWRMCQSLGIGCSWWLFCGRWGERSVGVFWSTYWRGFGVWVVGLSAEAEDAERSETVMPGREERIAILIWGDDVRAGMDLMNW